MLEFKRAKVAELADAPDLGSGGETHGGSSPPFRTKSVHPLKVLKNMTYVLSCRDEIESVETLDGRHFQQL